MSPTIKNLIDYCGTCNKRVPMSITRDEDNQIWTCHICGTHKTFGRIFREEKRE